jgi:hypothetical protein
VSVSGLVPRMFPSLFSAPPPTLTTLSREQLPPASASMASAAIAASASPSSNATVDQLRSLTHLPAGMMGALGTPSSARRSKRRQRRERLAADGEIIAKFFNDVASRPYPRNQISLEQTIQAELTLTQLFFTTSVSVPTYAAISFPLGGFTGYSSYTSVFDQYKVLQIEAWIEPADNQGTTVPALLATCVDLDDANTPGAFQVVADHQGALVGLSNAGRYHKWVPHVAIAAYSGTFTSYGNVPPIWIDSASTNVQQYGLKAAIGVSPSSYSFYITARAVVQFRAPGIN